MTEEQRPTMLTKRVSWVDGIADSKSAHIAISIPRHKYIKVCNVLFSVSILIGDYFVCFMFAEARLHCVRYGGYYDIYIYTQII